jgi:hypothetical protein
LTTGMAGMVLRAYTRQNMFFVCQFCLFVIDPLQITVFARQLRFRLVSLEWTFAFQGMMLVDLLRGSSCSGFSHIFTSHIQIISNLLSAQSKVWKEFWTPVLHFLPSPETFEVFVSCNLQELNLRSRI